MAHRSKNKEALRVLSVPGSHQTAALSARPQRDGLIASITAFLRDYARFAGRKGVVGAFLVLLGALFEGIGLALIAPLLAVLFQGGHHQGSLYRFADAVFGWLGATTAFGRLVAVLGLFAAAMILRAVVLLARDVTLAQLRIRFVELQRTRIAGALAAASWSQVVRLRHARIVQVMGGDIQQIGTAAHFLTQCLTAVVMLLAQSVLALYLSLPLALLSFGLLLASALALFPMMRRAEALGGFLTASGQNLLHDTAQFLGGLKLAVSQNLQKGFLAEFLATAQAQSTQQIDYLRRQTETRLVIATLSALVGVALVLIGLSMFKVPPAMLVALLLVVTRMSGPTGQIQQGAQLLAGALPAYEAVQTLRRELEVSAPVSAAADVSAPVDGEIRFDRVSFFHPHDGIGEARGVRDVSVSIARGKCLGIKGVSGSGKTTFADLLAGLYPPQSGAITVGGAPLSGPLLSRWRDRISYVAQDPFLFHDTIHRNLAWANPGASEAQMWDALDIAEAGAFVRSLSDGLDTVVGERGTLVSGGERQRLALARGILRQPILMILDEATNAVDPETEAILIDRLLASPQKFTLVIIAHRAECLVRCDRILTMEDGRLI